MTDLREFLTARYDEDQRIARAAIIDRENGDRWQVGSTVRREDYEFVSIHTSPPVVVEIAGAGFDATGGIHGERFATHIARWDPARVLAEVKAKRAILAEHAPADDGSGILFICRTCSRRDLPEWYGEYVPCPTLRILAAPYAEHPDFDSDWRIES
jgi:hypothetical protein